MKRSLSLSQSKDQISLSNDKNDHKMKKIKTSSLPEEDDHVLEEVLSDENLLFEVLKHVDAKTLGTASCVSKQWNVTAQDERLWEMICTQHWTNMGCGQKQLRSVVLALGGFRSLHAHYLWPLSKPSISTSVSPSSSSITVAAASRSLWPCLPPTRTIGLSKPVVAPKTRWGKDEVQLSLSLLSIRYYEKMSCNNNRKK
uniref:F-box protein GID2-like n=1 Tax=Erigeron canadensis TaxID=72917 RepID=UPI001CB8C0C7|nr:F-box protein GID2-like [Erigeron canadensis]